MAADDADLLERMSALRSEGRAFVLATVVRTIAATSAKAGAKAIVTEDGRVHGWIGGTAPRARSGARRARRSPTAGRD